MQDHSHLPSHLYVCILCVWVRTCVCDVCGWHTCVHVHTRVSLYLRACLACALHAL